MSALLLGGAQLLMLVQSATSAVQGTVREAETSRPLPQAVVSLPELGRSTVTDSAGRYRIDRLPDGAIPIAAHLLGYGRHRLVALLSPGAVLEIDIALQAEPIELPEIVSRSTAPRPRAPPAPDGSLANLLVSSDRLAVHPLVAEPDGLLALGGGEVAAQPESPSGLQVLGAAADQTAYLLDGIPVFSPYHSAGIFGAWNSDALAEYSLASTSPPPGAPAALGGTITGETRSPGARVQARGALSTSQARMTVDGPLGFGQAGFLMSVRSGFSDVRSPKREQDYLRGGTSDWLAKLQLPLFGGSARLLGYGNRNGFTASTLAVGTTLPALDSRNQFHWNATSVGAMWARPVAAGEVLVQGWSAGSDAGATWSVEQGGVALTSARRDLGLAASLTGRSTSVTTVAGIRIERSLTSYLLNYDSAPLADPDLRASTPVATGFLEQSRALGSGIGVTLGTSVIAEEGGLRLAPRVEARWKAAASVTITGSYARNYQFAQSLRNAESVVGNVFPVDLYLGAGPDAAPVARSDVFGLAARYQPSPGLRLGAQAYLRHSGGVVLVAPRSGEPFAVDGFATGSGMARGIALEAEINRPRFWAISRYRWQSSTLSDGTSSYVPAGSSAHSLEAGLTLLPSRTTSIRLGGTALVGRRATAVANRFEWESCNLRDQGCEFGGNPTHSGEVLGGTSLPAYLRLDISVRQQWAFPAVGRRATMAVFGTFTNLLGRENILTYARNTPTGGRTRIAMRPPAPLVAGLEWQF